MKRLILVLSVLALAAPALIAGGKGSVTGAYVEARTAEVFSGGCIMNSEAETVGKQAVLAWKVDRGSFNGINIDGLSVVALVRSIKVNKAAIADARLLWSDVDEPLSVAQPISNVGRKLVVKS